MSEKKDKRAKDQAKGQLASIREMVAALDRETAAKAYVKGLTKAQIIDLIEDEEGMGCNNDRDKDDLREELTDKITDETIEPEDFKFDEEEARERIQEDALSVQMRSGWCSSKEDMEPEEYTILLCTGGPACRIIGELDRGQPCSARLQFQDWFEPCSDYFLDQEEENDVIRYARQFWFGE